MSDALRHNSSLDGKFMNARKQELHKKNVNNQCINCYLA